MEREFLFAIVALLAKKLDGFELQELPFRHPGGGKTSTNYSGDGGQNSVSVGAEIRAFRVISRHALANVSCNKHR